MAVYEYVTENGDVDTIEVDEVIPETPAGRRRLQQLIDERTAARAAAAPAPAPIRMTPGQPETRLSGSLDPMQNVRGMSVLDQLRAMRAGPTEEQPPTTTFRNIVRAERPETAVEAFRARGLRAIPDAMEDLGIVSEMGATTGGELAGQRIGGALGAPLGPGGLAAGTALGGAVGATTGLAAERLATGEGMPSPRELATEFGMSLVPGFAEPVLKRLGRALTRRTPAAQIIRREAATELAREIPERAFHPMSRREAGQLFDAVRQSGVQFDLGDVAQGIADLTQGQTDELLRTVRRLDRLHSTGGRWEALVKGIAEDTVATHDIGDLQALHSAMRERIESVGPFEAQQLLRDFNDDLDRAIFQAPTSDAGEVARGQLRDARRAWARIRGAEELGELLENAIGTTSDASRDLISVATLSNQLRRNTTPLAKAVNRALDATPGGRRAFDETMKDVRRFFRVVETPLASDVAGLARMPIIGGIMREISDQMLRDPEEVSRIMRPLIEEAKAVVRAPDKALPAGKAAAIVNLLRRAFLPDEMESGLTEMLP